MHQHKKISRGFTLIELLVVIAIIGLLASVVLVSLSTARQKGRDAARVSAAQQVKNALELYYAANKTYPTGNAYSDLPSVISGPLSTYLKQVPNNLGYTMYESDGTYYQFLIDTETGRQFKRNLGCDEAFFSEVYENAFCVGMNVPGAQVSGGSSSGGNSEFGYTISGSDYIVSWNETNILTNDCRVVDSFNLNDGANGTGNPGSVSYPIASSHNDVLTLFCSDINGMDTQIAQLTLP